jgi:hypothetical protein
MTLAPKPVFGADLTFARTADRTRLIVRLGGCRVERWLLLVVLLCAESTR